ncbi:MAG: hypothetical protein LBC87_10495 [Fibromonadaceae bacterium]|jgi:hypothetical protein|nr:hypothetical protein [Fibromonadaceae bacterium]
MFKILKILFILTIVVQTISCASFKASEPRNFAAYESESDKFKAISSDGVLYRVSAYEQKSEASMDFWKEAFLLKMKNSNYKQEDSLNISIDGKVAIGYIFSFVNSTGHDLYLVAAVQSKEKMFVVEATGESSKFENRKKDILDAIGSININ